MKSKFLMMDDLTALDSGGIVLFPQDNKEGPFAKGDLLKAFNFSGVKDCVVVEVTDGIVGIKLVVEKARKQVKTKPRKKRKKKATTRKKSIKEKRGTK